MPKFTKPAKSIPEQIQNYKDRGMVISDENKVSHYLTFISYYRLGPYYRHFQQSQNDPGHQLKANTTFEDILRLYIFDRELRLLFIDALERIEVAVRTCISNQMSLQWGPHWYLNKLLFEPEFDWEQFIQSVHDRTGYYNPNERPACANHYFTKYDHPKLPPSWMIAEVLPLGTWSKIYPKISNPSSKISIAKTLGEAHPKPLASFLQRVTLLRNICAHHGLLWNRRFQSSPFEIALDGGIKLKGADGESLYFMAALVQKFLNIIAPGSQWSSRLHALLKQNPKLFVYMGFKPGWERNTFWKLQAH